MLKVEDIKKKFGNFEVLKGITFELHEKEILGFLGPNGAGKTTTIRIILGILKADEGSILFNDLHVNTDSCEFRKKFGILLEDTGLYDRLNAYENMEFTGELWDLEPRRIKERTEELFERLGIKDYAKKPVKTYSKGMKQRLALARALLPDTRFLILDEATSGIDIPTKVIIKEILKEERRKGKGILYSTHVLEEVEELCDRVFVIDRGEMRFYGTIDEFKKGKSLEQSFMELLR